MKKDKTPKKKKEPLLKTKVKPDRSIEVEMKSPTKSKLGKIVIIILVAGMTIFTLFGLVYAMIDAMNKLK